MSDKEFSLRCDILSLRIAGKIDSRFDTEKAISTVYSKEQIMNKPKVKLVGQNGNIFNILGIASRALKEAGYADEAKEMQTEVFASDSYEEALAIVLQYVDDDDEADDDDECECEECGITIDIDDYEYYGGLCEECYENGSM